MNNFELFIVTRENHTWTAKSAVQNLLLELTTKTDVTAIYNNDESWGQFQYWNIKTDLDPHEIRTTVRQLRHHHQIIRISVYDR